MWIEISMQMIIRSIQGLIRRLVNIQTVKDNFTMAKAQEQAQRTRKHCTVTITRALSIKISGKAREEVRMAAASC